ncbi:hypothetical protein GCM10022630_31660 [Thermobifida alba]
MQSDDKGFRDSEYAGNSGEDGDDNGWSRSSTAGPGRGCRIREDHGGVCAGRPSRGGGGAPGRLPPHHGLHPVDDQVERLCEPLGHSRLPQTGPA